MSSLGVTSDGVQHDSSQNIIDLTLNSNKDFSQSTIDLINQQLNVSELSVSALNLSPIYSPISLCIKYFDLFHSAFPWWSAIALGTLFLKFLLFPLTIYTQRHSAKVNQLMPQQMLLNEKINQARLVGDTIEFVKLSNELATLFKRNNTNPLKAMVDSIVQGPIFLTVFLTLRKMANYPVESLKTGGFSWISDLSIPDPFFVLPFCTSLVLWLTMELSFRYGKYYCLSFMNIILFYYRI